MILLILLVKKNLFKKYINLLDIFQIIYNLFINIFKNFTGYFIHFYSLIVSFYKIPLLSKSDFTIKIIKY